MKNLSLASTLLVLLLSSCSSQEKQKDSKQITYTIITPEGKKIVQEVSGDTGSKSFPDILTATPSQPTVVVQPVKISLNPQPAATVEAPASVTTQTEVEKQVAQATSSAQQTLIGKDNQVKNDILLKQADETLAENKTIPTTTPTESQDKPEVITVTKETVYPSTKQIPASMRVQPAAIVQASTPVKTAVVKVEEKTEESLPVVDAEKKEIITSNTATSVAAADTNTPPVLASSSEIGQCFGKVKVAGTFKEVEENVIVKPAYTKSVSIPAKYEYKDEEVVIREQSEKYIEIPPVYKTVNEEIIIEQERKEVITIPAKYQTVTEKVMVKPAQKVWKKGRGLIEKQGQDGEVMCLVEEPAVYENVEKNIVIEPEKTEERIIPAVKKIISKQVIVQPVKLEKVVVPAVKSTIQKKVVTQPEQVQTVEVPAVYKTIKKKIPVTDDRVEWSQILCEDNITPEIISKVQQGLVLKGYNLGNIDGIFGKQTLKAVDEYQKSIGMESSGITLKTLETLGISI